MRMTRTTLRVLEQLLQDPAGEHHGYDLMKATGIKGGSIYPILDRLEKETWVSASWRESEILGRPRRRCYTLTGHGIPRAKAALEDARGADTARRARTVESF